MSKETPAVMAEVMRERRRQDEKWGGPEHDDQHTVAYWFGWINTRYVRTSKIEESRRLLIEIAALAVAGAESLDRRFPDG